MAFVTFLTVTAIFVSLAAGNEIPSYIKRCSLSDPKFNQCLQKNAKEVISILQNEGDPEINQTALVTLRVPSFIIMLGDGLQFNTTGGAVEFFENLDISRIAFDQQGEILSLRFTTPKLSSSTWYNMKIKILGHSVAGQGRLMYTLYDNDMDYKAYLETIKVNNVEHYQVQRSENKFHGAINGATFYFTGLDEEDKRIGKNTNQMFNDNWKDLTELLTPMYEKVFCRIIDDTINKYLEVIPKNQLFLP